MIDPGFVRGFRRRRLEDALAALVREQGYRATTVSHVVARAHVARNAFYEEFRSLDDAFLSLLDRGFAGLLGAVGGACAREAVDDAGRSRTALGSLLARIAEEPDLTHACLIEAPCGGSEALARRLAAEEQAATLVEKALPADNRPEPLARCSRSARWCRNSISSSSWAMPGMRRPTSTSWRIRSRSWRSADRHDPRSSPGGPSS